MPTITKLDKPCGIRFKAIIRQRGRILKTKTFTRKADARIWAKRIEADIEMMEALGSPGASLILSELIDKYMDQWQGRDKSFIFNVDYWRVELGTRRVMDIRAQEIRTVLDRYAAGKPKRGDGVDKNGKPKTKEMNRPRAAATVNRQKAALSSIFRYALQQGHISSNPVRQVASKTENNKRVRWLDDDERKALLTACRASSWNKLHLLVLLALTTGARLGELLGLYWADIDFTAKTACLSHTKNGDNRILTLPTPALVQLRKFREIGGGLIFPSEKKPNQPFEFRKHWIKALSKSEIKDFRFHDLRHSAASYLVMNGATLYEAAEVLGHRSIETTKRYAHLSIEHKAELTERILGGMMEAET